MMNADNENLGQHQQRFNRRLTEKLDSLGFQMGGREDKGDQYIKYAAEVTFEEEEAEPNNANINPMMGL
jgi:hypothetical protein